MSDALRAAILDSGLNNAAIERETGIDRSSLSRFLTGERSLRLDLADRLARYFELALTQKATARAQSRGQKGFRDLELPQMRAAIASLQRHLDDLKRIYIEEKQRRTGDLPR